MTNTNSLEIDIWLNLTKSQRNIIDTLLSQLGDRGEALRVKYFLGRTSEL
jgi:hypothetical protein